MATSTLQQTARNTSQTVDRVEASQMLGVSVRTIDRYIKSGKLAAYQKSGRIWLKKNDVAELGRGSLVVKNTVQENHSPVRGTGARTAPSVQEINAAIQGAQGLEESDNVFYKELYEEAQRRLNEYQRKSDQNTQHMNELESQIMRLSTQAAVVQAAPMITKQIERVEVSSKEERFEIEMMKKEIHEKERACDTLRNEVEKEKTNKNIFAVLTYILLALQPIFWYFLR